MKYKNAGFKYIWQAFKAHEEGIDLFSAGGGVLHSKMSIVACDAETIQISDFKSWQAIAISNKFPCYFWDDKFDSMALGYLKQYVPDLIFPYKNFIGNGIEGFKQCRPVTNSDCMSSEYINHGDIK